MRGYLASIIAVCILALSSPVYAFPDAEIAGITGGPPLSLGFTDNPTSFVLKSNGTLLVTYGQVLRIVDMGLFALAATQPLDLSDDDDDTNDSPFNAAYYIENNDEVIISQERGYIVIYSLGSLSDEPTEAVVDDGKSLGPLVVNTLATTAYITNNTDRTIHVMSLSDLTVTNTITVGTLPGGYSDYTFTSAIFVEGSSKCYFTTDRGYVVVLEDGGTTITTMSTGSMDGDALADLAVTPNDDYIYVTNTTDVTVEKFVVGTGTYDKTIDISENSEPAGIVVTGVTNPTATYAYAAGGLGLSVIDTTNNDDVLDLGTGPDDHEPMPTSAAPKRLAPSSDGYVYMDLATTEVGVVSENPWVTISSFAYSGGGESLGTGETADFTFQSNKDGTYELRIGGDVDASGSVLTDIDGNTSGTVVADTDVTVSIPYDANSSLFTEGTNKIYIFVTDTSSNLGRNGELVSVDTPPDTLTLRSTGFGNTRVYIDFDKLTAEDMATYNVYVDTDPDEVLVKAVVSTAKPQPDSGSTVTVKVSGLTNGTLYYIAVEGVDAGGNVGPRANTLPDGSLASATPEVTVGPAGLVGDTGCTLLSKSNESSPIVVFILIIPLVLIGIFRGSWLVSRVSLILVIITATAIILVSGTAFAEAIGEEIEVKESPQWWSFELKTGFWMPTASSTKLFFGNCCNLITRAQGGLLIHGRYGIEQSAGFMYKSGTARGTSGAQSMDKFTLITIPMETNFVWRADYFKWRYLIPYLKGGVDYVYWREDVAGSTTDGLKWGGHVVGGLMIALGEMSEEVSRLDQDIGVNDMHLTLETQYQWINDFGGGGLDLSGWLFSIGLLFVF